MGVFIRGPHLGPVRTTIWSSGRRKGSGSSHVGRWVLAYILTGATFGVSPVLGCLLVAAEIAIAVTLLVRYLRPAKPAQSAARKPTRPASDAARWRADHVPASAEYKAAHPEGPRDWKPTT